MLVRAGGGYCFGALFVVVLFAVLLIVDFFFAFGLVLSSGCALPALARPVFFSGAMNLVFGFLIASGVAAMVWGWGPAWLVPFRLVKLSAWEV
jgi:hypothetical protein